MQSKAATVEQYLAELPPDRREALGVLRKVFLDNVDSDIEEMMSYGMIGYAIPHRVFPAGYHCDPTKPLGYGGMASQKQYMSLYLMTIYGEGGAGGPENAHGRWFREAWLKTGKKLDMGKCCVRFKKIDDLPLEVIAEAIRRVPSARYIEEYERALAVNKVAAAARSAARKAGAAKAGPAAKAGSATKKSSKASSAARAKRPAAKARGASKAPAKARATKKPSGRTPTPSRTR